MTSMVVFVEDDPLEQSLIEEACQRHAPQHEIVIMHGRDDLIEWLAETSLAQLQLLVLDEQMPKVNGLEVLQELQKEPVFRQIPILLFSNSTTDEETMAYYRAGARACIRKPSTWAEYQQTLAITLEFWLKRSVSLPAVVVD